MKRLSLLIALMLAVTIGGVYATWNYAQGNVLSREKYLKPSMTDKVVDNAKGVIDVNMESLSIVIDEDPSNKHHGKMNITGEIVITFTPNAGADEDVMANGIPLQVQLAVNGTNLYGESEIFTINTAQVSLNEGQATKSVTISSEMLKTWISLNDIYLPTVDDYSEFKAILNTCSIQLIVSEAPAAVTP